MIAKSGGNMKHRKEQHPNDLVEGSRIVYRSPGGQQIREGRFLRRESGILVVQVGNREEYVQPDKYMYTMTVSIDFQEQIQTVRGVIQEVNGTITERGLLLAAEVWTRCEQHYSIDVDGSKPKDVRRTIAFMILKGDKQTLDMAADLLGG
jgi:hypothetical protein